MYTLVSSFLIDEKEYHNILEKQISGREERKQVNISHQRGNKISKRDIEKKNNYFLTYFNDICICIIYF